MTNFTGILRLSRKRLNDRVASSSGIRLSICKAALLKKEVELFLCPQTRVWGMKGHHCEVHQRLELWDSGGWISGELYIQPSVKLSTVPFFISLDVHSPTLPPSPSLQNSYQCASQSQWSTLCWWNSWFHIGALEWQLHPHLTSSVGYPSAHSSHN